MFDQVTMTLNVDPYIRSALQEDITSEDVSTNSVMPEAKLGEVDLICKQDGIICGLQIFSRVFEMLDPKTKIELFAKDAPERRNGDESILCLPRQGGPGISVCFCAENVRHSIICSA